MSNEKAKLLDKETALTTQIEQVHTKLDKKWSLIQQGENPASQDLVNEVEELRVNPIYRIPHVTLFCF